jgi:hypothetical protein
MMPFVRVLLGALVALVTLGVSVPLYGFLAAWSPFPRTWWIHHMPWVTFASVALTVLPCVVFLGLILSKVYKQYPVRSAFISTTIALVVAFGASLHDPQQLPSDIGWTLGYFGPFLVGPPLVVLLLHRLRSNNPWRGP